MASGFSRLIRTITDHGKNRHAGSSLKLALLITVNAILHFTGNIFPVRLVTYTVARWKPPMSITSPLAYFVLVPCLIGIAGMLAHFIPQSRDKLWSRCADFLL